MDTLRNLLPLKIYEIIDRAGISTPKQVITLSKWDIKKLSGLKTIDIELLKNIVAKHISHQSTPCNKIICSKDDKIKSGCAEIDNILNGGIRRGVLTEIYGESGSGKTQLGLQFSANNAMEGNVYICTEDLFPIKRYNQIKENISQLQLCNNVFIEHVHEALDLLSCIRVRLPKLLHQHKVSLIIIDSVAAPFRCDTINYVQRAEDLRELAVILIKLAQDNNLAVVCINQVTANFDDSSSKLLPSLGLAWSNMISYRLWLKKCYAEKEYSHHSVEMNMRNLQIIFAPDLPNVSCYFNISSQGITNIL